MMAHWLTQRPHWRLCLALLALMLVYWLRYFYVGLVVFLGGHRLIRGYPHHYAQQIAVQQYRWLSELLAFALYQRDDLPFLSSSPY